MKPWTSSTGTNLKEYQSLVEERDARIGAFLHFDAAAKVERLDENVQEVVADERGKPELAGLPFAVKDNIAVRAMPLTCGSAFLKNFVSPYSATVVERLLAAGARPVGKTNLDEFGMGSSTDNSALQQTHNPWDTSRVCGGSSGGSAAAVAAGLVPFALGSDTGGSVRQPAAFCATYGLKPTYGAVSRYGLVAYASSLDVIGVLAGNLELTQKVFEHIRGHDLRDQTSVDFREFPIAKKQVQRIGVLTGELNVSDEVAEAYRDAADQLRASGYQLEELEIPSFKAVSATYHTIASAEASANLARFNGIRYGERPIYAENPDELVRKARSAGFGDEVKLRILLGTYVLRSGFQARYYQQAQKIRIKLRREFDELFSRIDLLLTPVYPVRAFRHGESELDNFQQRLADHFTAVANLTGMPGLACPVRVINRLPTAVQLLAPAFHEHLLFEGAQKLQEGFPLPVAPGYEAKFSLAKSVE